MAMGGVDHGRASSPTGCAADGRSSLRCRRDGSVYAPERGGVLLAHVLFLAAAAIILHPAHAETTIEWVDYGGVCFVGETIDLAVEVACDGDPDTECLGEPLAYDWVYDARMPDAMRAELDAASGPSPSLPCVLPLDTESIRYSLVVSVRGAEGTEVWSTEDLWAYERVASGTDAGTTAVGCSAVEGSHGVGWTLWLGLAAVGMRRRGAGLRVGHRA